MTTPDCHFADEMQHRFLLSKVLAVCKHGIHVGTAYLQDCIGPSAPPNLKTLDYIASVLSIIRGPWVLGGDFNCTPQQLYDTGFPELVGGVIQAPQDSTCGAKIYDYFIVSKDLAPSVLAAHCVADGLFSPHAPVRLLLRAAPRASRIRVLKAPRRFPAVLPHGPNTIGDIRESNNAKLIAAADTTVGINIDSEFAKLIRSVETQLSSVAGHDQYEAAKHAGRVDGPTFKWRCPSPMILKPIRRAPRRVPGLAPPRGYKP